MSTGVCASDCRASRIVAQDVTSNSCPATSALATLSLLAIPFALLRRFFDDVVDECDVQIDVVRDSGVSRANIQTQ